MALKKNPAKYKLKTKKSTQKRIRVVSIDYGFNLFIGRVFPDEVVQVFRLGSQTFDAKQEPSEEKFT